MVTLETERLVLRPPTGDDVDVFHEMHSDPEVMKYLTSVGASGGLSAAWRTVALLLGHWHLLGYGQWVVVERTTGAAVGRVGLWNSPGWPGLELSWMIRRSHWNRGLATEAAKEAARYAFATVEAERLISIIRPDNARSIRVAEKLGERFERVHTIDGTDFHVYGMHRPVL